MRHGARRVVAAIAATYAEDCVLESPSFGTVVGRPAVYKSLQSWFDAFPDARVEFVDAPVITGDRVVHTLTAVGTDTGGFLGQKPTRRPFRVFIVTLHDVADGQIVHDRRVFDISGLLLQLAQGDERAEETPRLYRGVLDAARLDHEMKIAATIQRALFPASQRKGEGYELAATSLPCRAIGGDFFDYFDVVDERLGFVLGDVAGKGPPAALLASRLQGMMAAFANGSNGPAHTATLVNRELSRMQSFLGLGAVAVALGLVVSVWQWQMGSVSANVMLTVAWTFVVYSVFTAVPLIARLPLLPRSLWTSLCASAIGLFRLGLTTSVTL
ncbi:MAG TPA: ester cyclase [Vicinamibacterales bacterium]|nr:ester cyclase [Vicinamibacterales bacterium]